MLRHRNPRPKVPKHPSTHNKRRRPRGSRNHRELLEAYAVLVRGNPRAASAVLDVLQIVASGDRRRSMALIEAAGMVVSSMRGRS